LGGLTLNSLNDLQPLESPVYGNVSTDDDGDVNSLYESTMRQFIRQLSGLQANQMLRAGAVGTVGLSKIPVPMSSSSSGCSPPVNYLFIHNWDVADINKIASSISTVTGKVDINVGPSAISDAIIYDAILISLNASKHTLQTKYWPVPPEKTVVQVGKFAALTIG
jgi:hypothetical protein